MKLKKQFIFNALTFIATLHWAKFDLNASQLQQALPL
jgi:hypothetical protein